MISPPKLKAEAGTSLASLAAYGKVNKSLAKWLAMGVPMPVA